MCVYTIDEVAEMLKVTRDAIYKWEKKGAIKIVRLGGTCPRITEEELQRFLKGE